MAELCASGAVPGKVPNLSLHLQGLAEFAELGMGTEKKEYLQDVSPESSVDLWHRRRLLSTTPVHSMAGDPSWLLVILILT